jgi:protoporphyrinogen oxidase
MLGYVNKGCPIQGILLSRDETMSETIIVIGAGIAGLSAGCYAQMNGYKTQIFEMHDKPGDVCTSWQRKGFTIDGCLERLVGSAPGSPIYLCWQELGMIQGQKIVNLDQFWRSN